ncbi:MAG: DUF4376 domain-containing protein [Desulfuromonas sp.]|nr:DUF4376 domain-containing protein [Desulfuromonas sp.]
MNYVKFTYVNQLYMPDFDGLQFDFALESEYPTVNPVFYGTCNSASGEGLIAVITKAEYEQDKASEMASRKVKADKQSLAQIAAKRWQVETAGFELNGSQVSTDRTAVAMVTGAALAASLDPEYSVRWKSANGFVTLNAEQILAMAQAIRSHVQSCFDREAELLDAINAGTYETEMLDTGWPDA